MSKISISETPLTLNPNDQIKVRDEIWRTKLKSDYREIEVPFEKLFRVVQSDYRTYSAGVFKNNYAKNENWINQELLILDVDDGLPIEEAIKMFSNYKAMIHTSASHQKEKGGIKCDRYRVIVQMKEVTNCTIKEYTDTMKYISKRVFDFIDDKCVDPARIYFGHFDCEIYYTDGTALFDFSKYKSIGEKMKEILEETQKPKEVKKTYEEGENLIENFNRDNTVENMLSRYGYKQQGNRWLSPSSSTGVAGVIIMECEDGIKRAYNHHSSDDWENESAFGVYAMMEYNGNMSEAVKSLTK